MRAIIRAHPKEPSTLEKLARKIEGDVPAKSVARRWRALKDIIGGGFKPGVGAPTPVAAAIVTLDHEPMQYYSDGSLRHAGGRIRGKKALKALKRLARKRG